MCQDQFQRRVLLRIESNLKIFKAQVMAFSKKKTRQFPRICNLSLLQPNLWEKKFGQIFHAISTGLNF